MSRGSVPLSTALNIFHEADHWMIKQSDIDWIFRFTPEQLDAMTRQDDSFRLATFMAALDKGMDEELAGKEVRKTFPMFYVQKSDRKIVGSMGPEDAKLPFCIKGRLGPLKLVMVGRKSKSFSSVNARVFAA